MRMTRAALRAQADQPLIHEDATTSPDINKDNHAEIDTTILREIVNLATDTTAPQISKKSIPGDDNELVVQQDFQQDQLLLTPSVQQCSPPNKVACSVTDVNDEQKETKSACDEALPATPIVSSSLAEPAPESTPSSGMMETGATIFEHTGASARTPKLDATVHESNKRTMEEKDDSFIQAIKSRTPGKMSAQDEAEDEDSFVENFTSRTPGQTSRIEDSVEAMDALEDAIEQFSGGLPMLDNLRIESPVKQRCDVPMKEKLQSSLKAQHPSVTASRNRTVSKSPAQSSCGTKRATDYVRVKPSILRPVAARQSTLGACGVVSNKSVPLQSSLKTSGKATMSFSISPLSVQSNPKTRTTSGPLSTSKAGFVPSKSTKAPTKSNFVLPGEIYAAKLKAEREAKQQASTEPQQFRARPAPKSRPSVLPRENKASQARMSMIPGSDTERARADVQHSPPTAPTTKRISSLDVAKARNPSNSGTKRASSTVSKASRASSKEPKFAANVPRVASLTTKPAAPLAEPEFAVTQKRVSGKEVFARSKLELRKQEDEKRQKEEAARKARAEAAERGRLASREWAEKKAKMAAAGAQKNAVK